MALPQQAIEQLTRRPVRTQGWYGRLMMFSVTVFVISIVVYAGLVFGYTPFLRTQVDSLDEEIKTFGEQVSLADQEALISFYSQVVNVQSLLTKHVRVSPLLAWLERTVLPGVYYTRMSVNTASRQVSLSGIARSVSELGEQVAVLQRQPEVERAMLTNAGTLTEGGVAWQFDVTISFEKNFFREAGETTSPPAGGSGEAAPAALPSDALPSAGSGDEGAIQSPPTATEGTSQ